MICEPAPKFCSKLNDSQTHAESNDSRTCSKVPIWIKWFAIGAGSPNQMICEPALKSKVNQIREPIRRSESSDLRKRSEVPIWIKLFVNPLRSPDPNQMICEPAPKFCSKLNDSQTHAESNDSRTCSKVPIWIKRFAICAPKQRV